MSALEHPLIDRFLEALWLEKGLSANTRASYRSDLMHFHGWLHERGIELLAVSREALGDHLAWRLDQGYHARSTARLLSRSEERRVGKECRTRGLPRRENTCK